MTKRFGNPKVCHVDWEEEGTRTPMVRIFSGPVFVLLHYEDARRVVDEIHDLCDTHDAQQRAQT